MTTDKPTTKPTTENLTSQKERQIPMTDVYVPTTKHKLGSDVYTSCQCKTQIATLGVLIGLLVLIIIVMTTGWVWTCCMMKKRGVKRETNIDQDRYVDLK